MMLVIFGLVSLQRLSVREYPDIDRPTVSITTAYRGASAAIIETKITQIVEDSVAGIEGILKLESDSEDERSQVRIEFDINRDIDAAANDVRDRIARVVGGLPTEADPPQVVKADAECRLRRHARVRVRHDVDARPHGLRGAQHRRPLVDRARRRERGHRRRPALLHAHLARPPGARGAQHDRDRHRGRTAPRERRAAGRPARVAHPRVLAAHDGRPRDRAGLPQPRDRARRGRPPRAARRARGRAARGRERALLQPLERRARPDAAGAGAVEGQHARHRARRAGRGRAHASRPARGHHAQRERRQRACRSRRRSAKC